MLQSEALGRVWEYIKTNQLEVICHIICMLNNLAWYVSCISRSAYRSFAVSKLIYKKYLFCFSSPYIRTGCVILILVLKLSYIDRNVCFTAFLV